MTEKVLNANGCVFTGRVLDLARDWAKSNFESSDSFFDGEYDPKKPTPFPQGGFSVIENESIPRDQVWLVSSAGEVLAKIVNLHVSEEN